MNIKKLIHLAIFVCISYALGFLNGFFLFGDVDIPSTFHRVDIELESDLKLVGGWGEDKNHYLTLPKGTYLHHLKSYHFEDTLLLEIVAYDIRFISSIVSDKQSKS